MDSDHLVRGSYENRYLGEPTTTLRGRTYWRQRLCHLGPDAGRRVSVINRKGPDSAPNNHRIAFQLGE